MDAEGLEVDPKSDIVIMEGELTDQKQIAECVCQCLIGNTQRNNFGGSKSL